MKLAAKLILMFLVAVILLTAANAYITVRGELSAFEREQQQHARQVGAAVEDSLVIAWRKEGREAAVRIVQQGTSRDQQVQVRWVSFDEASVAADRPSVPKGELPNPRHGEVFSITVRDAQGQGKLHTYYPIDIDHQQKGALEFTHSTKPVEEQARSTIVGSLATMGATAMLGIVMMIVAGIRLVGRPLEQLIEKTRRAAAGDFSSPLQLRGRDELSQLAVALNEMCDQLARSHEAIRSEVAARIATVEQLRHADRLKTVGRLAAGVAHELGTPLNVVAGRAGLIGAGKLSADEVQQSAATIKAEADKITKIIRELLDFARRSSPHRSLIDLKEVVEQTIALLQPLAEKKSVKLQVAVGGESMVANVDGGQIQQVLTNLIVNAIQAMPDGGEVTVGLQREHVHLPQDVEAAAGEFCRLYVKDQGVGMDAETLADIFVPFFTTKDVGQGTGLGLSIAYGIVQEHGGWIDVTSQPGQGSCFSVYLPL